MKNITVTFILLISLNFLIVLSVHSQESYVQNEKSKYNKTILTRKEKIETDEVLYGIWHIDFDDDQRFLVMDSPEISTEEEQTRARIISDPEYNQIYSDIFDDITIDKYFDPGERIDRDEVAPRSKAAKKAAFIYRMGIDPNGNDLTDEQKGILRSLVMGWIEILDESAWDDYDGSLPYGWNFNWFIQLITNNDISHLHYRAAELIYYLQAYDLIRPISNHVGYESVTQKLHDFSGLISTLCHFAARNHIGTIDGLASILPIHNYRLVVASAIGMSALVLPYYGTEEDEDEDKAFQPIYKIGIAMNFIDNTLFHTEWPMVLDDGGYVEGPHYLKFSSKYFLPFFRGMYNFCKKLNMGNPIGDWTEEYLTYELEAEPDLEINDIRTQWFGRIYDQHPDFNDIFQWITDIHMPNGKLPPLQDSFTFDYFLELASWNEDNFLWSNDELPSEISLTGSYDSRVEYIVAGLLPPQSFVSNNLVVTYPESGDIVFRSGNDVNSIYLHAYAKNYKYTQKGFHQSGYLSHNHFDNTSFMIYYKGEMLALDPGYICYDEHNRVFSPVNHNLIVVQGEGHYNGPYRCWNNASVNDIYENESNGFSHVNITATDWIYTPDFLLNRAFTFVENRYFIISDDVSSSIENANIAFLFHGNGGEFSFFDNAGNPVEGGHFDQIQNNGGMWFRVYDNRVGIATYTTVKDGCDDFWVVENNNPETSTCCHETSWEHWSYHAYTGFMKIATATKFLTIAYPFDGSYPPGFAEFSGSNYIGIVIYRGHLFLGNKHDIVIYKTGPGHINVPLQEVTFNLGNSYTINSISTDAELSIISIPEYNEPTKLFAKEVSHYNYGILHFAPAEALTSEFDVNIWGTASQEETYNYCEENGYSFPPENYSLNIESGSNVTSASANNIIINPGFHAYEGSDFHAYIDPSICESDNIRQVGNHLLAGDRSIVDEIPESEEPIEELLDNDNNLLDIPANYCIFPNYPNPFNPSTTIRYGLPEQSDVVLHVYNIKGQLVKTLENSIQPAGYHEVTWYGKDSNDKNVASGLYFYKLSSGKETQVKKMLLLK